MFTPLSVGPAKAKSNAGILSRHVSIQGHALVTLPDRRLLARTWCQDHHPRQYTPIVRRRLRMAALSGGERRSCNGQDNGALAVRAAAGSSYGGLGPLKLRRGQSSYPVNYSRTRAGPVLPLVMAPDVAVDCDGGPLARLKLQPCRCSAPRRASEEGFLPRRRPLRS